MNTDRNAVIIERYKAGESYTTIAKALLISRSTVSGVVHRSKKRREIANREMRMKVFDVAKVAYASRWFSAGDVAEFMDMTLQTVAQHLVILAREGHLARAKVKGEPSIYKIAA